VCWGIEWDSKWTEVGFDEFPVVLGARVEFVSSSELDVGDMEVLLFASVETENVVEADVAFCLDDTVLDAREAETLVDWVVALVDVWTQPPWQLVIVSVAVSTIVAVVSEDERLETDVVFAKRTEGAMTGTRRYVVDVLLVWTWEVVAEDIQTEDERVEESL
jgi:hypothetical protein